MLLCTLFTKHLALLLFIFFFSLSLHPLSSLSASLPFRVRVRNQTVCIWRKLGVSRSRGYVVCEVCWNGAINLLAGWRTLENSYLIRWSRIQSILALLESPIRWWHVGTHTSQYGPTSGYHSNNKDTPWLHTKFQRHSWSHCLLVEWFRDGDF